eukprot:CAMPEP_0184049446 /NCGR_PEP_ID=MMETSP0956-20121227/3433_1 /TAXON_ID=627963 /ORGANISM="Aplanochytrium sp, Strain PBS07" /LENGTH=1476 /DNA_ID=CAMNT_0026341775 /DNA_START=261 /DNA_END=4691 /DNA_ORIENTATION=+
MIVQDDSIDATKPPNDEKVYRHVTLENGMQCMLISTENSTKDVPQDRVTTYLKTRKRSVRHSNYSMIRNSVAKELANSLSVLVQAQEELPDFGKNPRFSTTLSLPGASLNPKKRASARDRRSITNHGRKPSGVTSAMLADAGRTSSRLSLLSADKRGHSRVSQVLSALNAEEELELKSGPSVRMAAVSLAVGVGSFAEPADYHGLAHFLEHMLFMGSEKYNTENEFDKFLARVGGSSNAYTDSERTVYHFTCPQDSLRDALDIFAQFFIAPLLLEEAGRRELESIEEEFALRQNDDDCRLLELWRHTARRGTPFSRFTCGNRKTLGGGSSEVFKKLREFHEQYYVGPNMRLVVQGVDEVDSLQALVVDLFQNVRGDPEVDIIPSFTRYGVPWRIGDPDIAKALDEEGNVWKEILRHDTGPEQIDVIPAGQDGACLGCVFRVMPLQDTNELSMIWQLPPQSKNKNSRPTDYVTFLLGHESSGSILAETKARGWTTGLYATACTMDGFEDNTACTMLNLTIVLTRQGLQEWIYVAGMVFEYIGLLLRTEPQKWIMDELIEVYKAQYKYAEETDASTRTQDLSVSMLPQWDYSPRHLLDMGLLDNLKWDPDLIKSILQQLNPNLVRIDLSSSVFRVDRDPSTDGSEPEAASKSKKKDKGSKRKQSKDSKRRKPERSKISGVDLDSTFSVAPGNYDIFNKPIRRLPFREPFTKLPYWADRIPRHIMKMWEELYQGKTTVTCEPDQGGNEKSARSIGKLRALGYPKPNKYIAKKFDIKQLQPRFSKEALKHPMVGRELKVRHSGLTDPMPIIEATSEGLTSIKGSSSRGKSSDSKIKHSKSLKGKSEPKVWNWRKAKVVFVETKLKKVILEYENGLKQWYRLPSKASDNQDFLWRVENDPTFFKGKGTKFLLDEHIHVIMVEDEDDKTRVEASEIKVESKETDIVSQRFSRMKRKTAVNAGNLTLMDISDFALMFPKMPEKNDQKIPILVDGSDNRFALWHLQEQSRQSPRTEIRLQMISPLVTESAENATLNDLFGILVAEILRDESYMAVVAELDIVIEPFENGQSIHIFGFSDKLPQLLREAVQCFVEVASFGKKSNWKRGKGKGISDLVDQPVFYAQLESLALAYFNEGAQFQSSGMLSSAMYRVLVKGTIHPENKASAADTIEPSQLAEFAFAFLSNCKVETLVTGNADLTEACAMFDTIKQLLEVMQPSMVPSHELPVHKIIDIPVSAVVDSKDDWFALSGLVHPLEALEFPGHSVDLYFHIGSDNIKNRVLVNLIEQMMREPLYAELRTRQQLGYMVKCSSVALYGKLGFVIELTSGKYGPQYLAQDIDSFLLQFGGTLMNMSKDMFFDHVTALARKKLEDPKGASHAVERHWDTVRQCNNYGERTYRWNPHFAEVEVLKTYVTPQILYNAYEKWLLPVSKSRRRVSVVVFGHGHQGQPLRDLQDRSSYITVVNGPELEVKSETAARARGCKMM